MNVRKIESSDNPRLRLARKVRDGKEDDLIFVEGDRLAEEAVRSGIPVEYCIIDHSYAGEVRNAQLLDQVASKTSEIFEVNDRSFSTIADAISSQGIIMICKRPRADRQTFERTVASRSTSFPLAVLLYEVNNPSNLGAVIRTAEAAGVAGVIVSNNSADVFSPKGLRGSMGSTFRIPIWAGASFADALNWSARNGYSTIGAAANANRSYLDLDWRVPHLLVMGSEAHGIPEAIERELDENVGIPMDENVESLNLAVAAGIVVFEARRQVTASRKS